MSSDGEDDAEDGHHDEADDEDGLVDVCPVHPCWCDAPDEDCGSWWKVHSIARRNTNILRRSPLVSFR